MAPCDLSDKVGNPWYDTQGLSQFDTSLTRSLCLGTSGQLLCVCQTIHISPSSSLHFPTPLRFLWGPPSTSSLGRPESQSSLEAVVALACCELFLKLSFKFKRVFFCISICFAYTKTVTLASLASPAEDLHSASLWGSEQKHLPSDYKLSKTPGILGTWLYGQGTHHHWLHHFVDVEHSVFYFFPPS